MFLTWCIDVVSSTFLLSYSFFIAFFPPFFSYLFTYLLLNVILISFFFTDSIANSLTQTITHSPTYPPINSLTNTLPTLTHTRTHSLSSLTFTGPLLKAVTSAKLSPRGKYALVGYGVRNQGVVEDHPYRCA